MERPIWFFPANNEGKIFTTSLDGRLVHKLDAPTADDNFEQPEVHDYFLGGGNFSPTAVEYLEGLYYVTTGYCNLDYVLTARVTPDQRFEAVWNDLAWGGKGDGIGQFGTGHGITKPPGMVRLDVADRPHSRFERFTRYGHYLSSLRHALGFVALRHQLPGPADTAWSPRWKARTRPKARPSTSSRMKNWFPPS